MEPWVPELAGHFVLRRIPSYQTALSKGRAQQQRHIFGNWLLHTAAWRIPASSLGVRSASEVSEVDFAFTRDKVDRSGQSNTVIDDPAVTDTRGQRPIEGGARLQFEYDCTEDLAAGDKVEVVFVKLGGGSCTALSRDVSDSTATLTLSTIFSLLK